MADWTNQDVNTLLPGEPWTSAKAIAAFENPQAIAEAAPNAPKNAVKSQSARGSSVTFSGFGEWQGFTANVFGAATGTPFAASVSFSDDGTTFYGSEDIIIAPANTTSQSYIACDFASQTLIGSYVNTTDVIGINFALTGGAFNVTHVRFTSNGIVGVTIHANGGQSTA